MTNSRESKSFAFQKRPSVRAFFTDFIAKRPPLSTEKPSISTSLPTILPAFFTLYFLRGVSLCNDFSRVKLFSKEVRINRIENLGTSYHLFCLFLFRCRSLSVPGDED